MNRRDQILESAADLFASKGFHGVSVGEIGRACGISGPALYKHFESKDAVLAAMLVGISERLLEEGRERVEKARTPSEALESLVAWHTDFALQHRWTKNLKLVDYVHGWMANVEIDKALRKQGLPRG